MSSQDDNEEKFIPDDTHSPSDMGVSTFGLVYDELLSSMTCEQKEELEGLQVKDVKKNSKSSNKQKKPSIDDELGFNLLDWQGNLKKKGKYLPEYDQGLFSEQGYDRLFRESNILSKICKAKYSHIQHRKGIISEGDMVHSAEKIQVTANFVKAIEDKISDGGNALIAEIKKASPSKGIIRKNFDVVDIAQQYRDGGATCLSVLTDISFFHGYDKYVRIAKRISGLPVLRKDFILHPYQVYESKFIGADCILLIMSALNNRQAAVLENIAMEIGLEVLVEVHNERELERALSLRSKLIGINNRNLHTFKIDLLTTERLAAKVPKDKIVVCESGIYTHEDIMHMNEYYVYSFLVGESLMREDDIKIATEKLLNLS